MCSVSFDLTPSNASVVCRKRVHASMNIAVKMCLVFFLLITTRAFEPKLHCPNKLKDDH